MSNRLTFIGASRGMARRTSRIVARLVAWPVAGLGLSRVSHRRVSQCTTRPGAPHASVRRPDAPPGWPNHAAPHVSARHAPQRTAHRSTPYVSAHHTSQHTTRLNAPHVSTHCTPQRTAHLNALRASRHRVSQCTPQCAARLSAPAGCSIQQAKPARHPMSQRTACLATPRVSVRRTPQCATRLSAPRISGSHAPRRIKRDAAQREQSAKMSHGTGMHRAGMHHPGMHRAGMKKCITTV